MRSISDELYRIRKNVNFCLDVINVFAYYKTMKSSEFKRWLTGQGATFTAAKGSHFRVELNGNVSYLPMHNKELGTGLVKAIKKQLKLK